MLVASAAISAAKVSGPADSAGSAKFFRFCFPPTPPPGNDAAHQEPPHAGSGIHTRGEQLCDRMDSQQERETNTFTRVQVYIATVLLHPILLSQGNKGPLLLSTHVLRQVGCELVGQVKRSQYKTDMYVSTHTGHWNNQR